MSFSSGASSWVGHNIAIVTFTLEGAFFKYYSIAFAILPSIAGRLAWVYVRPNTLEMSNRKLIYKKALRKKIQPSATIIVLY